MAEPIHIQGRNTPTRIQILSPEETQETLRLIHKNRDHWVKRVLGSENTMKNIKLPKEIKEIIYFYTLGGTVNYDSDIDKET